MNKKCLIDEGYLMSLLGAYIVLSESKGLTDHDNLREIKDAVKNSIKNPIDLDDKIIVDRKTLQIISDMSIYDIPDKIDELLDSQALKGGSYV